MNRQISDSRPQAAASELTSRSLRAPNTPRSREPAEGSAAAFHHGRHHASDPSSRAETPAAPGLAGLAATLRDSFVDTALAAKSFWAEAHKLPFEGHTVGGDDHLVGPTRVPPAKIARTARPREERFLPGSLGAVSRASDSWQEDMRALQGSVHYRAYRYAWLASRIVAGSLSPLQAGIFIGAAALPAIDARFPAASEAARHTLMAASIVADPFGFAAGSAALMAVRFAMQNASEDRRAFWQCMTFLLTRQLSSHALAV